METVSLNSIQQTVVNSVNSITATAFEGTYMLELNVTTDQGEIQDIVYALTQDDPYGLSPYLRQWMIDNPEFPIGPYVPPPPMPYSIGISDLWGRMTDDEAEAFDIAMSTAPPLRLRKQFGTATSMMSDSELCGFVRGVLTSAINETRADELLAQ